jgi:hypothetical protein
MPGNTAVLNNGIGDDIEIDADIRERIERTARGLQLPLGFQFDNDTPLMAPVELVQGTISRHGTGVLGGQSGAGKTFLAVHLMVCAAAAKPFLGREIREPVAGVYLAAEGSGTIAHRFRAAKRHAEIDELLPVTYSGKVGDLLDEKQLVKTIGDLKQCGDYFRAHFDVPHGLTVIDTASMAFRTKDENSNAEIARICQVLARLYQETGAFTCVVHHMGKDQSAGLRGGSAWRGNVDSVLLCLADREPLTGECRNHRAVVEKHRDGLEGPIGSFELALVELGEDDFGEPFFSRAIRFLGEVKSRTAKEKPSHHHFREAFNEVVPTYGRNHEPMKSPPGLRGPVVLAVPRAALCSEFKRRHPVNSKRPENTDKAKQAAFDRALAELTGQFAKYGYEHVNGEEIVWRL